MDKKQIHVEVVKDISSAIFRPADWSIVNIPESEIDAKCLLLSLFNSPVSRHITLVVCRHRRKFRLDAISNMAKAAKDWTFLDTITMLYEKPSSCSNNGFLPISEVGFILYKGAAPDTKNTKWFNDNLSNATTMWDLAKQPEEERPTYYQKFSWELNMLMMSLSKTLETQKFIYGLPVNREDVRTIYRFCAKYNVQAQLYVSSFDEAQMINEECNKAANLYKKST